MSERLCIKLMLAYFYFDNSNMDHIITKFAKFTCTVVYILYRISSNSSRPRIVPHEHCHGKPGFGVKLPTANISEYIYGMKLIYRRS